MVWMLRMGWATDQGDLDFVGHTVEPSASKRRVWLEELVARLKPAIEAHIAANMPDILRLMGRASRDGGPSRWAQNVPPIKLPLTQTSYCSVDDAQCLVSLSDGTGSIWTAQWVRLPMLEVGGGLAPVLPAGVEEHVKALIAYND